LTDDVSATTKPVVPGETSVPFSTDFFQHDPIQRRPECGVLERNRCLLHDRLRNSGLRLDDLDLRFGGIGFGLDHADLRAGGPPAWSRRLRLGRVVIGFKLLLANSFALVRNRVCFPMGRLGLTNAC
jgi:hypothetical protein